MRAVLGALLCLSLSSVAQAKSNREVLNEAANWLRKEIGSHQEYGSAGVIKTRGRDCSIEIDYRVSGYDIVPVASVRSVDHDKLVVESGTFDFGGSLSAENCHFISDKPQSMQLSCQWKRCDHTGCVDEKSILAADLSDESLHAFTVNSVRCLIYFEMNPANGS